MSKSKLATKHDLIVRMLNDGESRRAIAKYLGVGKSTLTDYVSNHVSVETQDEGDDLPAAIEREEIPVIVREYDEEQHFVYPLGDVHIGAENHERGLWKQWLEYLEERDDASMLGTGDFLNSAIKGSVSEVYDEDLTVGKAKRQFRRDIKGVAEAGKIDLLMPGNHEDRIYRAVGDCPIEDVADTYEVPYAKVAAVLIYKVGDIEYSCYVRHGTGGGMIGARASRLQRQAQTLIADLYVSGHTHSQLVFPQEIFVVQGHEVVRRRQYFVSSGSFMSMEEYAARQGYAPQRIGAPRIRLDGTRHDIHVSV